MASTYNAATNTRTVTVQRKKKTGGVGSLTPEQRKFAEGMTTKTRAAAGGYSGDIRDMPARQREAAGLKPRAQIEMERGLPPRSTASTGQVSTPLQGTAPGPSMSPQDEAAMKLAAALRGQGMNWDYTPGQSYAPPAAAVGGTAWQRIQNMPSLLELMYQAADASGVPRADFLAEIQQFQQTGPSYSMLNYGW